MGTALVLYQASLGLAFKRDVLGELVARAGPEAASASDDFFHGAIRNEHTRRAYRHAVKGILVWAARHGIRLTDITPGDVGRYFDTLAGKTSISTRKQHLAALRHFFDGMVTRHVVFTNPALSVRGERYETVEGKTPEITVAHARQLLASISTSNVIGLRDRALLAILTYTAARVGAASALRRGDFYDAGDQWMFHFNEKNGKSREIPVRHDLVGMIFDYLDAAGLRNAPQGTPIFQSAKKNGKELSGAQFHVNDVCRMMKRRLKPLGLSKRLSPHSFRVTTITDLLDQNVPLEDVQRLAGHADPRTTRLYDRRDRQITRNIVERISI